MSDMKCSASVCPERKQLTPTLLCSGICKKYFHAKCVGLNGSVLDKINNPKLGLYWYCEPCRKLSLSTLSFNIEKIGQAIGELGARFSDLSTSFKVVENDFQNISQLRASVQPAEKVIEDHTSIGTSADQPSTAVDTVNNPDLTLNSLRDSTDPSTVVDAVKNLEPIATYPISPVNLGRKRRRPRTAKLVPSLESPPPKRLLSGDPGLSELDNTDRVNHTPRLNISPSVPLPLTSTHSLMVVPKPKTIFVSRFSPQTMPTDVVNYLRSNSSKTLDPVIKCDKISGPNSLIASFKIVVHNSEFERLISPDAWPPGTFIKEFVPNPRSATNRSSRSTLPGSKN